MRKYCTEIDDSGFMIATFLLSNDEIASFDGKLLVDVTPPAGVGIPLNAKWDGAQWIEGTTQEEIDAVEAEKN